MGIIDITIPHVRMMGRKPKEFNCQPLPTWKFKICLLHPGFYDCHPGLRFSMKNTPLLQNSQEIVKNWMWVGT